MGSAQISFNEAVAILTAQMPNDTWAVATLDVGHASRREEPPDDMDVPGAAVAIFLKGAVERKLCSCRGRPAGATERSLIDPVVMHDFDIWPGVGRPQEPDGEPEAIAIARAYSAAVGEPPTGDHQYDALRFFEEEIEGLRSAFEAWHVSGYAWWAIRDVTTPIKGRTRTRDPEAKASVDMKNRAVWREALAKWPNEKQRPSVRRMARELTGTGYSKETVRKILSKPAPD